MSDAPAYHFNFEEIGLSKEEYEEQIAIFLKFEKEDHKFPKDDSDEEKLQPNTDISVQQLQDHKKEVEGEELSSSALIRQLLENDGLNLNEIESILTSSQIKQAEPAINKHEIPVEEEEEKEYAPKLEIYQPQRNDYNIKEYDNVDIPEDVKKLLSEMALADQNYHLTEMKNEEADMELINKLMAEELQQKENRTQEEEKVSQDFINSMLEKEEEKNQGSVKTDCPICLDNLFSQDVFPLSNCEHLFHIECLESYIIEEIKKRTFPIRCPQPGCKQEIAEDEVKDALQAHIEYQDIYDEYYIKFYLESNPKDFYYCPTPDCGFVFCLAEGPRFNCPECQKHYCMSCKTEWHERLECEEYQKLKKAQGDDVFVEFAKELKLTRCPKCEIFVERIEGCNAMSCTRCHAQFCYECGREGDGHYCNHGGQPQVQPPGLHQVLPQILIRPFVRPIQKPKKPNNRRRK